MSRLPKGVTLRDRLISKRKIMRNGCWKWTGLNTSPQLKNHPNNLIYGQIKIGSKTFKVHRAAWIEFRGTIPEGKNVLHRCDFSLCFNPDHLFLGTQLDNMRDCSKKGRISKGEQHPKSLLTNSLVRKIRASSKPGTKTGSNRALARKFGICKTMIGLVIQRKRWSHVK